MSGESPEQLLDSFRAAALSVTKLYKTSIAAHAKSRADGYQDAVDDLIAFLDKESIGLTDSTGGEGWRIRKWAVERLEGRGDMVSQGAESDEEPDGNSKNNSNNNNHTNSTKADRFSSPELPSRSTQLTIQRQSGEVHMRDSAPPTVAAPATQPVALRDSTTIMSDEPAEITVPTQEIFTFQSSHPYPQDAYISLANLDLSDSRGHDPPTRSAIVSTPSARSSRARNGGREGGRSGSRGTLGRGAGQKRKVNLAEIFDLSSLGHSSGRDVFGGGGGGGGGSGGGGGGGGTKRSRHA